MQYFGGQLPPALHALPQQARRELAALLLTNDADDAELIALPADIEASLAAVAARIADGTEPMFSAASVISDMKNKYA